MTQVRRTCFRITFSSNTQLQKIIVFKVVYCYFIYNYTTLYKKLHLPDPANKRAGMSVAEKELLDQLDTNSIPE